MIGSSILRVFPARVLERVIKHNPLIEGRVLLETRERGKLISRRKGSNIWTLSGREYLAELIALSARSPRTLFRNDRVAYIGMGSGAQAEVSNITSLVDPVVYKTGEYLAALATPATFPSSGTTTSSTSTRFIREFSTGELSLGYNVVLTEAGLFTDGDPDNDWDTSSTPTDFSTAAGRAPVAYKTFEPITKTTQFTLKVVWDVRIV
jgi:hypothetical protein